MLGRNSHLQPQKHNRNTAFQLRRIFPSTAAYGANLFDGKLRGGERVAPKTDGIMGQRAYLEVYDHRKHEDRGNEVHEVGQVLPVEGFSQGAHFVRASGQQMKERDDGALKLGTCANRRRAELRPGARM